MTWSLGGLNRDIWVAEPARAYKVFMHNHADTLCNHGPNLIFRCLLEPGPTASPEFPRRTASTRSHSKITTVYFDSYGHGAAGVRLDTPMSVYGYNLACRSCCMAYQESQYGLIPPLPAACNLNDHERPPVSVSSHLVSCGLRHVSFRWRLHFILFISNLSNSVHRLYLLFSKASSSAVIGVAAANCEHSKLLTI